MQIVFNRKEKDPLLQVAETARALRLAAAREAMNRAWNQLGGVRAPIGLPLHRQIQVESSARDPFEHCAAFRGGLLTLSDDGRWATATEIEEVQVSCVGVEWLGAVERQRALCGAIAVFGPASASLDVACFPARGSLPPPSPGDAGRYAALDLALMRAGRLQDYWVWVVLLGGADGAVDGGRARPAEAVAHRLRGAILSAAGDANGVTAEGLVQRQSFKESVAQAFAGGARAPGDASAPVCVRLHWNALGERPAAPRPRQDPDGATGPIGWTHRIVVPAAAGDDRCAVYLRACTTVEPRSISVEIPAPAPTRVSGR